MHFVRCIMPNKYKQQGQFERELVLTQLKTSCIVSYAQFIRFGYSKRIDFQELVNRCKSLEDKFQNDSFNRQYFYSKVLLSIGFKHEDFKMGSGVIFFRSNKFNLLEKIFSNMTGIPYLTLEQKNVRR